MFFIFVIVTYLLSLLIANLTVRDRISKFIIFTHLSYWLICLAFSYFNPFGLYEVSSRTYAIFILHTLSFLIGFLVVYPRINNEGLSAIGVKCWETIDKIQKNKLWLIFCCCYILLMLYVFYQYKEVILIYTVSDVARNIDLLFEDKGLLSSVYRLVLPAFNIIFVFLLTYSFLYKKEWKYIVIYAIPVVIKSLIGGSRGSIMIIVVYIGILYLFSFFLGVRHKNSKMLTTKKIALLSIAFIFVYVTASYLSYLRNITRGGEATELTINAIEEGARDLNKDILVYHIGPFRAFDYAMERNYLKNIGGYQYGRATFMGLEGFISMFTTQIGYEIKTVYDKTVKVQQANIITIGNSSHDGPIEFNFAYTNAMIFYYDLGVWGVFLFSFLYGMMTRVAIKRLYRKKSLFSLMIVTYLFYSITRVGFQWVFVSPAIFIFLFLLLFCDLSIWGGKRSYLKTQN